MLQEPIVIDPDVAQAIEDLRETAAEIRTRSSAFAKLPANHSQRGDEQQYIVELTASITVRAERLGLTTNQLLTLIEQNPRERTAAEWKRLESLEALAAAIDREHAAHRALTAAQQEVRAATSGRLAAEEASAVTRADASADRASAR